MSNQRQGSYHKEQMRIQTKNKEIAWGVGKRERTERKKKNNNSNNKTSS